MQTPAARRRIHIFSCTPYYVRKFFFDFNAPNGVIARAIVFPNADNQVISSPSPPGSQSSSSPLSLVDYMLISVLIFAQFLPLASAIVGFRGLDEEARMEPDFRLNNRGGAFAFGRLRRTEENLHDPTVKFNAGGHEMSVPKGMYQYTEKQRDFESNFQLPNFESPFDISGEMKSKDNQINGFYLPMPYGMEPVNIQVVQERERDNALGGNINAEDPLVEALADAKRLCAQAATLRCDQALQHYFQMRSKQVAEDEAPLHEKLIKLGDTISATGYKNEERNGLGVLFGLPGMEPMFWEAKLRRFNNNNVKMRVQP